MWSVVEGQFNEQGGRRNHLTIFAANILWVVGLLETLRTSIMYPHSSRMASRKGITVYLIETGKKGDWKEPRCMKTKKTFWQLHAEGLLHMSAMASSCKDVLRSASTQTDHVFPMLDPNYLVPPNQKLSVEVAALQEELESLKHSFLKSPLQLMANSKQKTKFYTWLPT